MKIPLIDPVGKQGIKKNIHTKNIETFKIWIQN